MIVLKNIADTDTGFVLGNIFGQLFGVTYLYEWPLAFVAVLCYFLNRLISCN